MSRRPTVGVVGLVLCALVVVAAMNASRLPLIGESGREVTAHFEEIGGLRPGDPVQVAGVDAGTVQELTMGRGHVAVTFTVDPGIDLGRETRAAVSISNLLGSKHVEVVPAGAGELAAPIPVSRTEVPYDLTAAFGDLTRELEPIDTRALEDALSALDRTFRGAGPDVRAALRGMSALSRTVASRDRELGRLVRESRTLTTSLARSRQDIARLLEAANLLLGELDRRRRAIRGLIVHTRELTEELRGLVADNREQLRPALLALDRVTGQLAARQADLRATLRGVTKFARVFVNTIGGGPWFDSYIGNAPDTLKLEDPR